MNNKRIDDLLSKQMHTWIKVKDYEFLYNKNNGRKILQGMLKAGINTDDTSMVDIFLDSVINWRGVKLKHLIKNEEISDSGATPEELETDIDFTIDRLNLLITNNLFLFPEIVNTISGKNNETNKELEEIKKN